MNLKKLIFGRMNRAPFWGYFFLIRSVEYAVCSPFILVLDRSAVIKINFIHIVFSLALAWILIKRLHDLDWPTILAFIPFISALLVFDVLPTRIPQLILRYGMQVLIFCCFFLKGSKGPNTYGPDPLEGEIDK